MKRHIILALILTFALFTTACSGNASQQAPPSSSSSEAVQDGADSQSGSTGESDVPEDSADYVSSDGTVSSSEDLIFPLGDQMPVSDYFIGTTYLSALIPNDDIYNTAAMNNVTFEPGARNNWHSHEGGQALIVTGGVGYYQEEGQPAQIIRTGDVVIIGSNVKHWHGAATDSWFSHIAIATNPDQPGIEWMEPVADEEYGSLDAVEFSDRDNGAGNADNILDGFVFPKGEQMQSSDNFSGPVYISQVVARDNAINCPSMSNVTFEPGVRNSWHMHGGGQILIVTGGIGYHQVEGEPAEILYPGDVAMCPPGGTHWHGATADSWFSHIALGTNPGVGGMEWLNPITDEEYANLPTE